jgi:hypothetical protein
MPKRGQLLHWVGCGFSRCSVVGSGYLKKVAYKNASVRPGLVKLFRMPLNSIHWFRRVTHYLDGALLLRGQQDKTGRKHLDLIIMARRDE